MLFAACWTDAGDLRIKPGRYEVNTCIEPGIKFNIQSTRSYSRRMGIFFPRIPINQNRD